MSQTTKNISSDSLKIYYDDIKEKYFTYIDTISIEYLSFPYGSSLKKSEQIKIAYQAYETASGLQSIRSAARKFPKAIYKRKNFYDNIQLYGEENPERLLKEYGASLKMIQSPYLTLN